MYTLNVYTRHIYHSIVYNMKFLGINFLNVTYALEIKFILKQQTFIFDYQSSSFVFCNIQYKQYFKYFYDE